jgi:hypothetical protein
LKALVDENLPHSLARALSELAKAQDQDEVMHVFDVAERATPDDELFRIIAAQGFRVHITQDNHNRKALERRVIAECGLIVFQLAKSWSSQQYWEKSVQLIRWWPAIRSHAERMRPPAIFGVPWKLSGKGQFQQIRL